MAVAISLMRNPVSITFYVMTVMRANNEMHSMNVTHLMNVKCDARDECGKRDA